jgi:hypothetical protein
MSAGNKIGRGNAIEIEMSVVLTDLGLFLAFLLYGYSSAIPKTNSPSSVWLLAGCFCWRARC